MKLKEIEVGRTVTIPGKYENVRVSLRAEVNAEDAWKHAADLDKECLKIANSLAAKDSPEWRTLAREFEASQRVMEGLQNKIKKMYKLVGEEEKPTAESDYVCVHCGGDIRVRYSEPNGKFPNPNHVVCEHVHYPESCEECEKNDRNN